MAVEGAVIALDEAGLVDDVKTRTNVLPQHTKAWLGKPLK